MHCNIRRSWERKAKIAFEVGACELLAELLESFGTSPEIFRSSMLALSALGHFDAHLAHMLQTGIATQIVSACASYFTNACEDDDVSQDTADNMETAFKLMNRLASHNVQGFADIGGVTSSVTIAFSACQYTPSRPSKYTAKYLSTVVQAAGVLLDSVSRTKAGMDCLVEPTMVDQLLVCVSTSFFTSTAEPGANEARSTFRKTLPPAASSGSGDSADGLADQHLGPILKLLDRLSRTQTGLGYLQASTSAVTQLSATMTIVQHVPALVVLVVRLLGRILEGDFSRLLTTVEGFTQEGGVAEEADRILAARMLASLLQDEEYVELVARAGAGDAVMRLLGAARDVDILVAKACLFTALREVAAFSTENRATLAQSDAVGITCRALAAHAADPLLTSEASQCLAQIIDCREIAELLVGTEVEVDGVGAMGGTDLVGYLVSAHQESADEGDAVGSVLLLVERLAFFECVGDAAWCHAVADGALAAMGIVTGNFELQCVATDVLIYLADNEDATRHMVQGGCIAHCIRNLKGDAIPNAEDAAALGLVRPPTAELAKLVASSLYLMASMCTVPDHVPVAKEGGCIRGVLAGFTRFPTDPVVYANFRDVIRVLNISEEEVLESLHRVNYWCRQLRAMYTTGEEAWRPADELIALRGVGLPEDTVPVEDTAQNVSKMTMTAAAELLLEGISLLEAVAVSPMLVAVIVRGDGIDSLLHTMLILASIKTIKRSTKPKLIKAAGRSKASRASVFDAASLLGRAAGQAKKLPSQGILGSTQDEVMTRACNTLSQLARVAYEVSSGDMSNDADWQEYEEVSWDSIGLSTDLYSRRVMDALTHSMSTLTGLQLFASSSLTLVSWLAVGSTPLLTRTQVELLVSSGVVEACVALMRAHQSSMTVCSDAAGALSRIAAISKGAVAVTTRGASRQLIRMLGPAARMRTDAGDELLLAFLRLLETCSSAGESCTILKKQGLVDAVVEAVEGIISGTSFGLTAAGEEGESGGATGTGQRSEHMVNSSTRSAIETTVSSILSSLVDRAEVQNVLVDLVAQKDSLIEAVQTYEAGTTLAWPSFSYGRLSALASKFGLLSGTDAAMRVGADVLASGAQAMQELGSHAVYVMATDNAAEVVPDPATCQAEMAILLPVTLRSLKQVLRSMGAGLSPEELEPDELEAVRTTAQNAAEYVITTARDHPEHSGDALAALAAIALEPTAAALLPGSAEGTGMDIILSAFHRGGELGNERLSTACMITLKGIASVEEMKPHVAVPEVVATTLTQLGDTVNEAGADMQSAALALLALLADNESVLHDLVTGGIFGIIRTILTRHCGDPYSPNEALLKAVAELLPRLCSAWAVVGESAEGGAEGESASAAAGTLRRVARVSQSSTGYLDSPETMVAVLHLIAHACSARTTSTAVAQRNKDALMEAGADDMVVLAMSSSAATAAVLSSGRRALAALGLSSKFKSYVQQLMEHCESIDAWLEAGWEPDCAEVTEIVAGGGDVLRNMSAMLVTGGGAEEEEGGGDSLEEEMVANMLSEVMLTDIFNAVLAMITTLSPMQVQRNDTASMAGTTVADCYTKRADALSVSVQIVGRLAKLVPLALQVKGEEAVEGVSADTIVATAHAVIRLGVAEVRVVESAVRAVQASLAVWPGDTLSATVSHRLVPTLTRLARLVRHALHKAKLSGSNAKAGKVGPMSHLSTSDLHRLEGAIVTCLREVQTSSQRLLSAGGEDAASIKTGAAFLDLLLCAAVADPPGEDPIGADDDGDLPELINAVLDSEGGMDLLWEALELLPATIKPRAVRGGGMFASSSDKSAELPEGVAADEEEEMSVEGAQARVRVLHALLRAVMEREVPEDEQGLPVGPDSAVLNGRVARLRALFEGLKSAEDLVYGTGRRWKRKVLSGKDTTGKSPIERFRHAAKQVMLANRWGGWEHEEPSSKQQAGEAGIAANSQVLDVTKAYGCGVRNLALRLLSRMDVDGSDAEAQGLMCTPAVVGDVAELLMFDKTHPSAELVSGEPEAGTEEEGEEPDAVAAVFGGVTTEALRVIARLAGLYAPKGPGTEEAASLHKARIHAMAKLGVFNAAALALRSQPTNLTFAREAVLLLNGVCSVDEVGVAGAGLKQEALLAMQATVKSFQGDQVVQEAGSELVAVLSEVYAGQSGRVFGVKCGGASEQAKDCRVTRHKSSDGSHYEYQLGPGERVRECPAEFATMMEGLVKLNDMSRMLDETAVVAVPADVIQRMVDGIHAHAHDPGVSGILICALGKLAENEENHPALMKAKIVETCKSLLATHEEDAKVCSGIAAVLQPLSFDPDCTIAISDSGCTRELVKMTERFKGFMTRFCGPPMSWPMEGHEAENQEPLMATGAGAEEKNTLDPRLAKVCVQTLANLACANEEEPAEASNPAFKGKTPRSVDVIVQAKGIATFGSLMKEHMDNPRLLEDAMCALSNIAYVSVDIQLEIGRVCIDTVIAVAMNFHSDEHLFRMALRAIGNLTRCDENIMRVVGYGAIEAIVKGMRFHKGVPEVLQLAADVIGNLASVDKEQISMELGTSILRECNDARHAHDASNGQAEKDAFLKRITGLETAKDAVCTCLYEDGGPQALLAAIEQYNTEEDLVTACLRALHYAGSGEVLIGRMIEEQGLVDKVVLAMRSCDYNSELLRRGVRVLGQALTVGAARQHVLRAGVPQVLLTAIDTHHQVDPSDPDKTASAMGLCSTCYAVLHEIPCDSVFSSVRELGSINVTLKILRQHIKHAQYAAIILSVLDGWCDQPDLNEMVAKQGMPVIIDLGKIHMEDVFLLASVLQFTSKLAKREQNYKALLEGRVMQLLETVTTDMLRKNAADKDAEIAYKHRPVTMQLVQLIARLVHAGKEACHGVLEAGGWKLLSSLKTAYEALQSGGQIFYDRETCESIEGIQAALKKHEFPDLEIPGFNTGGEAAEEEEEPPLEGPPGRMLETMLSKSYSASAWVDSCKQKLKVAVAFLPVSKSLVVEATGTDTGKMPVVTLKHSDVGKPVEALPDGVKAGGMFSKGPNAKKVLQLKSAAGEVLAVMELDSEKDKAVFSSVLEYIKKGGTRAASKK